MIAPYPPIHSGKRGGVVGQRVFESASGKILTLDFVVIEIAGVPHSFL